MIDIIKPLSTVLSNAIKKCLQHLTKYYWESRESNWGPLGAKQECYPGNDNRISKKIKNILYIEGGIKSFIDLKKTEEPRVGG